MTTTGDRIRLIVPKEKLQRAIDLAKQRNEKQKFFGAMTYGGVRGSLEAHLLGIVPEMAVCHYFGTDIDERIFDRKGDEGQDTILPHYGVTQVKATTYWDNPWLRAEVEHDHNGIDTYMLVYINKRDIDDVWLVGCLPRCEVITKRKSRLVSNGPMNYVVEESELNPVPPKPRDLLVELVRAAVHQNSDRVKELILTIEKRMTV